MCSFIVRDSKGQELLQIIEPTTLSENDVAAILKPMRLSLMLIYKDGKCLFQYHKERGLWEIPGGTIEQSEKPYDTAIRELFEETNIVAKSLIYLGCLKLKKASGEIQYGCLYKNTINEFKQYNNDEVQDGFLWDCISDLHNVNEIDRYLAIRFKDD